MNSKPRYYKPFPSIEVCPIWNFSKVTDTGNPAYIFIMDDYFTIPKLTKKQRNLSIKSWEFLFNEYLETFGLPEKAMKILKWEAKIAKMKIQMLEKRNWGMQAAINIEQKALDREKEKDEKGSLEETIAFIEQHRKIALDQFKCSVKMFYTYVNLMNADAKKERAKNLSKKARE